jgi:TRAP-type mannitol/chloroaromatic compound transport system permease large subunit
MDLAIHLVLFFGGLAVFLLVGLPVAIAFTLVNLIGVYVFWGGAIGLSQLILSIDSSVSTFVLVPVPMFILMGTVMFHSGVAYRMIDLLDQWLGRIAGRLAVLAIGARRRSRRGCRRRFFRKTPWLRAGRSCPVRRPPGAVAAPRLSWGRG